MFARFTPEARRTTVRAGLLSLDHGRTTLDEDMFLLALAESWPVTGFAASPETTAPETGTPSAAAAPETATLSEVTPSATAPSGGASETAAPSKATPRAAGAEAFIPGAVTPEAVVAEIRNREVPGVRAGGRELLAAIGVDLDEIRRRLPARREDPLAWRLTRSRLRPLNVTLSGPAGDLLLTARARKVVEVALYASGSGSGSGSKVTGEDLLKGLLADSSNASVSILRGLGVDLRGLAASVGFLREPA